MRFYHKTIYDLIWVRSGVPSVSHPLSSTQKSHSFLAPKSQNPSVQQTPHFNTKNPSVHHPPQFNTSLRSTHRIPQFNTAKHSVQHNDGFCVLNWWGVEPRRVLNWAIWVAEKAWSLYWTDVLNLGGLCGIDGYSFDPHLRNFLSFSERVWLKRDSKCLESN